MSVKDMLCTFTTEDGTEKKTIREYEADDDLRHLFGRQATPPQGRQTLFMGKDFFSYSDQALRDTKRRKAFESLEALYSENPLKYFVPQCDTIVDFLNWKHDDPAYTFRVLHAGVGSGKTIAGIVCWLLSIVPTEPDWPIFEWGIKRRDYRGPYVEGGVAVVSYQITNHQNTIWPQAIKRWCPKEYIRPYIDGKQRISWRANPSVDIAGTPVYFLVSSQRDVAFVSQALDIIHWDEQSTEDKFNNANDRVARRGGWHVQTMTPHYVQGQPETGAGSYVDRIRKGEMDVSLDVQFFQLNKLEVNDWVVTKEDKEAALEEYIHAPMRQHNVKKLAEGRSKVYGEFHERSCMVIDEWDRAIHVIPPITPGDDWCFYRFHDHGRKEPCAAMLVGVSPENEYFILDEYYERDREIRQNARGIVEDMTENTIQDVNGAKIEQEVNRRIVRTIGDPRSLSKGLDATSLTIGEEYARHGLFVTGGSGQPVEKLVPLLGQLLNVDPDREHFLTHQMGAPRIYVCSNCTNFIWEIENWRMKAAKKVQGNVVTTVEKPEPRNDHLMTCAMMLGAEQPVYVPQERKRHRDRWDDDDDEKEPEAVCEITGY